MIDYCVDNNNYMIKEKCLSHYWDGQCLFQNYAPVHFPFAHVGQLLLLICLFVFVYFSFVYLFIFCGKFKSFHIVRFLGKNNPYIYTHIFSNNKYIYLLIFKSGYAFLAPLFIFGRNVHMYILISIVKSAICTGSQRTWNCLTLLQFGPFA